jgi:hypothetical protein
MSQAVNILRNQVDASAEAWKVDHVEAMACRDVERLLACGLELFSIGRRADDEWSRSVEAGSPFDVAKAEGIIEFYRWWIGPCDHILRRIEESERKSYKVDRADEFRKAVCLTRGIISMSAESIGRSMQQAASGETISLDEALYGQSGKADDRSSPAA